MKKLANNFICAAAMMMAAAAAFSACEPQEGKVDPKLPALHSAVPLTIQDPDHA